LGILSFASIVYLLLILIILWLFRRLETKLLMLGFLTAVLAVFVGRAWGEVAVSTPAGTASVSPSGHILIGTDAGAVLGRIAVLLVLSALALILVGRWAPVLSAADVLPAGDREEVGRGSPT
jgi:hypothetical protein